MQNHLRLFALLGAVAVGLGAFGAHGLKSLVGPAELATFTTGVRYQFYHTLAIGLAALLATTATVRADRVRYAVICFTLGIALFSGSLYLLSLREVHGLPVAFLGPITPIGGVLFIAGWVLLGLSPVKSARA